MTTNLARRLPLLFYYDRLNRYSFNALAGALDSDPELAELPVGLPRTRHELKQAAGHLIDRHGRFFLGLSVLTCQFAEFRHLVGELRTEYGDRMTLIAGGPHATAAPCHVLACGVDFVIRGEGEASFPMLLRRLVREEDIRDLDGIAFRKDKDLFEGTRSHPVDIETYPSFSPKRMMFGPVEMTRGCAFACSYCQTSSIFGTRLRHRSVGSILRQADTLATRSGRVVRLLSPNAFSYGSSDGRKLNLEAMNELLRALRHALGSHGRIVFGYFPSEVRPEHVTPDTLELLRRYADNDEIVIGAQSGSQRVLDACHRSHQVDTVLTAVSRARRSGYKVIVDFIFGLPGENSQDVHETVRVIEELSRMGARIHPHVFSPLPQTAFEAEPPGILSPAVLETLEKLHLRGAVYGGRAWHNPSQCAH